jgi:hypothetical protein
MSKTTILITGCQRSGTTLMRLVVNSHPDILSIDEDRFDYPSINTYLEAPWLPTIVSFKLPQYAPILPFIKSLPNARVLWCIRDPVDTVWSMVNLQRKLSQYETVSWAAHPLCAQSEIRNSYWILDDTLKRQLAQNIDKFVTIANKNPKDRTRMEIIFTGALCWKIKNELPGQYEKEGIDYHTVRYESLVTKQSETISEVLSYIGVGWNDNVLKHHELHNGMSIGDTSNTRPIDSSGVERGIRNFTSEELELIQTVCTSTADKWNYKFLR